MRYLSKERRFKKRLRTFRINSRTSTNRWSWDWMNLIHTREASIRNWSAKIVSWSMSITWNRMLWNSFWTSWQMLRASWEWTVKNSRDSSWKNRSDNIKSRRLIIKFNWIKRIWVFLRLEIEFWQGWKKTTIQSPTCKKGKSIDYVELSKSRKILTFTRRKSEILKLLYKTKRLKNKTRKNMRSYIRKIEKWTSS